MLTSVCIPVYNGADFLAECIESVLDQTVPTRLLIYDDASTDATPDIIAEYYASHPTRIIPYRFDENFGSAEKAWREAIADAVGTHLFYLSHDDRLKRPYALEVLHECGTDVAYGNLDVIDASGRFLEVWDYREWPIDPDGLVALAGANATAPMPIEALWSLDFLRRNNLTIERLPNTRLAVDAATTIRWLRAKPTIGRVGCSTVEYRYHEDNETHRLADEAETMRADIRALVKGEHDAKTT